MTGHVCPACGTPRAADGRAGPGCDCAERAAEAVRAERQAEIAAAEDFDPLRIRPYVTLEGPEEPAGEPAAETGTGTGTLPGMGTLPVPVPVTVASSRPAVTQPVAGGPEDAEDPHPQGLAPRRRQPFAGLIVGAAAVAVAGTAAFAGGLFSGEDTRERAIPDTETSAPIVSAVPDAPSSSPSRSASPSASASPSRTPSATASSSRTAPSSPSPVRPSTPPPSTMRATGRVSQKPPTRPPEGTLRRGDSGPEVVELQQRLAQVWLYGDPADGQYGQSVEDAVRVFQWDRDVQGDPEGVYGPNTRRALESETGEP